MTSHGNARIVKVPVDPADKIQFVDKSSLSSNKSIFLWNLLMESLVWIFVCGRLCSFLDEGVVVKMSQKHFYGRLVFHILVPNQIQSIRNIFPNQIIDLISREFRAAFKRILCKFFCQTKWKKHLIFKSSTQIKCGENLGASNRQKPVVRRRNTTKSLDKSDTAASSRQSNCQSGQSFIFAKCATFAFLQLFKFCYYAPSPNAPICIWCEEGEK